MEKKFLDLEGLQRYNQALKNGSLVVGKAATANGVKSDGIEWGNSVIPLKNIPPAALERVTVVADDAARLKLTTATVQTGDTVKVTSTKKMYFVKDDTKLNSEAGYEEYVAGKVADSVAWDNITGKPSVFPPSAHDASLVKLSGQTSNPDNNGKDVGKAIDGISGKLRQLERVMEVMPTELDRLHVLPYSRKKEGQIPVADAKAPKGSTVDVEYDPQNKTFVAVVGTNFYAHWDGEEKYGTPSAIGAEPVEGQIFYCKGTNDFSAFIDGHLRIIGEGSEFTELKNEIQVFRAYTRQTLQPVPIPNTEIDALFK